KVHKILNAILDEGMTLLLFLNAISWGDEWCTADDCVHYACMGLLVSEELPNIPSRWYRSP
ncbi:hypothetical protein OG21DRAFT_1373694, partial [Imleria badia]